MTQHTQPITQFTVPWGQQEISLEELRFEAGGLPLLRVRIREGKRFTIFDIDPATAATWAQAMQRWSEQTQDAPHDQA
ncbi:MAG: hypothetical protein AB3X41_02350 [Leptothrix ochracea]|uniref:DUF6967 family protein n=1 Tax=Leptothrix ochracea TaxID=735331 RepID=UPI0034E1AFD9